MNYTDVERAAERVGLRWEDGCRGAVFVYGPVESPTYIKLRKPMFGNPLVVSDGKDELEFDVLAHPDLRKATVESVQPQKTDTGSTLVNLVYTDPLRDKDWRDTMREVFFEPVPPEPTHKLNTDRTVAVATDYFWNEDMSTCPLGAKVQLLGIGGVASYGNYNGRDPFWVAWAPLPKRRTV